MYVLTAWYCQLQFYFIYVRPQRYLTSKIHPSVSQVLLRIASVCRGNYYNIKRYSCSQCCRGTKRVFAVAPLLQLRFRNPTRGTMSVSCECCVVRVLSLTQKCPTECVFVCVCVCLCVCV